MSGTATIAITVGVAVAVLVGFFIVYYLGNVANSIYDVKVGVRKDFDKKVKELQEWIDKDTKQRVNWMRDENKEEGKRFKDSMEGHLEETFIEMEKTVERLRADVASLQVQVHSLQEGKGAKPVKFNEAPPMKRPSANKEQTIPGLGDLEVARVGVPDSEDAPDLAAPNKGAASAKMSEKGDGPTAPGKPTPPPPPASSGKPTPPPPPASSKSPAGRASVEKKAKSKKKRKNTGGFETFDQFSEDFKPGG